MKLHTLNRLLFGGLLAVAAVVTSCKKESESTFDIFKGLTISFKEAIASDEVYVEFNLSKASSGSVMAKVVVTETGGTTPVYVLPIDYVNRYSFQSGVIVVKTTNPTSPSYKIKVLDDLGKDITSLVTITYPSGQQVNKSPVLITNAQTVTYAEGTTAYIDYNIHSESGNIKYIWLESFATGSTEPSRVNIATLADSVVDKRNFRGVVRLNMERNGGSKFRIYVTDEANDYIGDGYTSLNTNVDAGYELSANKFIYPTLLDATSTTPDLVSACFYSILKKRTYNYTEAKDNAADIDFCMYYTKNNNLYTLNLFSLKNATNPLAGKFDFTGWTPRGTTYFTSIPTVAQLGGAEPIQAATVFNTIMVSGKSIRQAVGAGRYATLLTRTSVTNIVPGNIMFFKTTEGKFGAIFFNSFGINSDGKLYTNIDVKIEK